MQSPPAPRSGFPGSLRCQGTGGSGLPQAGRCTGYPRRVHELAIAIDLVDAACVRAAELDARVSVVHVRIGALSGVVPEALVFSFDLAAADTPLAGARLAIEELPVAVRCPRCGGEPRVVPAHRLRCPDCDAPTPDVVSGRELELYALEVCE
jgi:hydrogenase nickel incorporation protein HypA/HybF